MFKQEQIKQKMINKQQEVLQTCNQISFAISHFLTQFTCYMLSS